MVVAIVEVIIKDFNLCCIVNPIGDTDLCQDHLKAKGITTKAEIEYYGRHKKCNHPMRTFNYLCYCPLGY